MRKVINLTGKQYGRLTAIKHIGKDKHNNAMWKCKCSCGNTIIVRGATLRNGKANSCGCLHKEMTKDLAKNNITHNMSNTRLYRVWQNIKSRCYYKQNNRYENYGGRGIKVCDEWKNDFKSFYEWAVTNGYKDTLTIDRINVNGDYEPNNCRWSTLIQQGRNKRNNKTYTINGETRCLSEWCELLNLNYNTVSTRIHRNWAIEKALELL